MADQEPSELEQFLTACDNFGLRLHTQRIMDSRFIGEDGKEYFRLNMDRAVRHMKDTLPDWIPTQEEPSSSIRILDPDGTVRDAPLGRE